jgi:hypothetical protein
MDVTSEYPASSAVTLVHLIRDVRAEYNKQSGVNITYGNAKQDDESIPRPDPPDVRVIAPGFSLFLARLHEHKRSMNKQLWQNNQTDLSGDDDVLDTAGLFLDKVLILIVVFCILLDHS